MNIPEKQFNKLSQLDRIEFRQKLDKCNVYINVIDVIFYTLIISFVFAVGGYNHLAIDLLTIAFYAIIFQIIFYIIGILITENRKRKLCEEYFKVEVKKK